MAQPLTAAESTRSPGGIAAALEAFDLANAADPNLEQSGGERLPKELLYGRRMSAWLDRLYPDASDALRLAARCQHLERWVTPRASYPAGRIGYLTWRRDLKACHAARAAEILGGLGYPQALIERVAALVRKERLKQDPECQALEDVACLVFLEFYFAAFAAGHDTSKVVSILHKTWGKMSARGRAAALELKLPPTARRLVERVLAQGE